MTIHFNCFIHNSRLAGAIDVYLLHAAATSDQWPECLGMFKTLQRDPLVPEYYDCAATSEQAAFAMAVRSALRARACQYLDPIRQQAAQLRLRGGHMAAGEQVRSALPRGS